MPDGKTIAEVWCGSEFTLAVDDKDGNLWSCGWNEHGNLGIGKVDSTNKWQEVISWKSSKSVRVHLWEGSLACGGGHVIYM